MSSRHRAVPEVAPHAVTPSLTEAVSAVSPFVNSNTLANVKAEYVENVKAEEADEVDAVLDGEDIDMKFKMPGRMKKEKSMSIHTMELTSGLWLKNRDWLANRMFVLYGGDVYVTHSDEISPIAKISDGMNTVEANKASVIVTGDKNGRIDAMIQYFDSEGRNICSCKMVCDPPSATLYVMTVMGMPVTATNLNTALDESGKWMAFAVFSAKFYDDPRFDLADASLDMDMSIRESTRASQRSSMRSSIPDSRRGSYRM